MRRVVFIASSLIIIASFNLAIYQKEKLKQEGQLLLLELAPVDPRSLIQGDYMRLRYAIETDLHHQSSQQRGYMVVLLDQSRVAKFARFYDEKPLLPNEHLLRFHNRHGNVSIVPDSFMFQEGHALLYQNAKYGIFKFDSDGKYILVGLADKDRKLIEPTP